MSSDGGVTWIVNTHSNAAYTGVVGTSTASLFAMCTYNGPKRIYIGTGNFPNIKWIQSQSDTNAWTNICANSDLSKIVVSGTNTSLWKSEDNGFNYTPYPESGGNWKSSFMSLNGDVIGVITSDIILMNFYSKKKPPVCLSTMRVFYV